MICLCKCSRWFQKTLAMGNKPACLDMTRVHTYSPHGKNSKQHFMGLWELGRSLIYVPGGGASPSPTTNPNRHKNLRYPSVLIFGGIHLGSLGVINYPNQTKSSEIRKIWVLKIRLEVYLKPSKQIPKRIILARKSLRWD